MKCVDAIRIILLLCFKSLLILGFGCGEDSEERAVAVESKPPPQTENARYDHPEGDPGFSPDSPAGHCMVFAGYDSTNMEVYLSDPADNLKIGHQAKATFKPHKIRFINDYCTTTIADVPATVAGAVLILPPGRKPGGTPQRWTQYGMPDLSQHAIQPDWQCYCAPTSAANVISYFSESYQSLSPRVAFAKDSDFDLGRRWLNNRLIAGNRAPFPVAKSLAARMSTSSSGGTSIENIRAGVRSYLDEYAEKPEDWKVDLVMENESVPDGEGLWRRLSSHCAAGDGILLCVLWGIPVQQSSPSSFEPSENTLQQEEDSGDGGDKQPQADQVTEQPISPPSVEPNPSKEGSRGVEIDIPEGEPVEIETRKKNEIIDNEAVIVDDFNLIERNGLWYKIGKNQPFSGKARRSYPNGRTLMEIPYRKGKKNGIQTIWEENGTVMRKVIWRNGKVSR